MTTAGLLTGYWSTNIGNSFFQIGAEYLLEQVSGLRVVQVSDQPHYGPSFLGGHKTSRLCMAEWMDLDWLVVLGPCFRPEVDEILGETLRLCRKNDTKLMFIGAGMMDYSESAISGYATFLSDLEPEILMSRDERTYEALGEYASHAYSGIDPAFFLPEVVQPAPLVADRPIVVNHDKDPEPRFRPVGDGDGSSPSAPIAFQLDDRSFIGEYTPWLRLLKELGSTRVLGRKLVDLLPRSYPARIGDRKVVRTDHSFVMGGALSRDDPTLFQSDVPYSYLHLYAGAELVLTDRVHATVAALAYGTPVLFHYETGRARLLERMGFDLPFGEPQVLDRARLAEEQGGMVSFLQTALEPDV